MNRWWILAGHATLCAACLLAGGTSSVGLALVRVPPWLSTFLLVASQITSLPSSSPLTPPLIAPALIVPARTPAHRPLLTPRLLQSFDSDTEGAGWDPYFGEEARERCFLVGVALKQQARAGVGAGGDVRVCVGVGGSYGEVVRAWGVHAAAWECCAPALISPAPASNGTPTHRRFI